MSEKVEIDPRMVDLYTNWHWGIEPDRTVDWDDPDFPDDLIEIGRLMELRVMPVEGGRVYNITVAGADVENAHVAFDPHHPAQRIYLCVPKRLRSTLLRRFRPPEDEFVPLVQVAQAVGSRHGKMTDYPGVAVYPLGLLTHVTYLTHKKGDGLSAYIHEMGEEGGIPPAIALDATGRLWLAGGSYTCPNPGITH